MRFKIAEQDIFYYPDLILACDPDDRETCYCTRSAGARSIAVPRSGRWMYSPKGRGGLTVSRSRYRWM
ncbi:MAG: hypothetical protein ACUVQI_02160 [Thermochromatium sp.]